MSTRIPVGFSPHIKIESVEGDLRLVGWDADEILIKGEADSISLQQDDQSVVISSVIDLSLNVPKNASVHILTVNGDMSLRGLTGTLEADTINGDVSMRDMGSVTLGAVESDFSLRGAKGDVRVRSIGGDASLRDVDGSLTLDSVSDDLSVRGVGGSLKVDVDEDVIVHLEPRPGQEYTVTAGDDIMLVLPPEASATLTISADDINVDWPGIAPGSGASRVITLGDGAAQIKLDAGGDVVVTNRADAAESADEYGNFAGMMFDWGDWGREVGEHWGGFGRDLGERISQRAQEAARRAERKAGAVARRVERQVRHGAQGIVNAGRWKWDFPAGKPPRSAAPVSDEERMTILRMLAEKKITAEEAEKLLSALEGGA
ncbi:MAG: SHOCT-like domain-containing protein [Chloroflexota bacterium]